MKRVCSVVSFCAVVAVAGGGVGAQSPEQRKSPERVTVSGCVMRDSAYVPDRPVGGSSTEFLLMSAPDVRASKAERVTFGLIGTAEQQLDRHVGRRVEVIGTIDTTRDQQQPTGGATDPVTGAGVPPGVPASLSKSGSASPGVRLLQIISFKSIEGRC